MQGFWTALCPKISFKLSHARPTLWGPALCFQGPGETSDVDASGEAWVVGSALAKAAGGVLDRPTLPVIDACALQVLVEVHAGALIHMHLHRRTVASCDKIISCQ